MNLINFIGRAHAQIGTGGVVNSNGSNFNLDQFNFLNPLKTTNLNTLVGTIIGILLTIAALTAFIYLLIAGFQYITAGGDAEKATKARTGIINAIIGIIVILVAYVILRYVGTSLIPGS
ncbi:MAG TPA: hypothetical protein VLE93_00240 [Candidatus Saccharimonadales bacterium]|nr:hypothetical protein [Candidatus Saccharimonadales bacterium]